MEKNTVCTRVAVSGATCLLLPAIRRDRLEIFLTSARLGTLGGLDLWVSRRSSMSDPWSPPLNLGPVVNSASDDARAALSIDATEVYLQANPLPKSRSIRTTYGVDTGGGGAVGVRRLGAADNL